MDYIRPVYDLFRRRGRARKRRRPKSLHDQAAPADPVTPTAADPVFIVIRTIALCIYI